MISTAAVLQSFHSCVNTWSRICIQMRRAIEALEARALHDSMAPLFNSLHNRVDSITLWLWRQNWNWENSACGYCAFRLTEWLAAIYSWLLQTDISSMCQSITALYKLVLTLPATSCSNERSFSVLKFVEKTGCVQQWDRNAWKISLILAVEAEQTQQLDLNHIRELFCVCQPCSRCYSGTWLTDADCCVCSAASAGITRSSRSQVFTFWFTSTCMWPQ